MTVIVIRGMTKSLSEEMGIGGVYQGQKNLQFPDVIANYTHTRSFLALSDKDVLKFTGDSGDMEKRQRNKRYGSINLPIKKRKEKICMDL